MEEIKLYRLIDEGNECTVGTEEEVINYHNEWVEASGRFEEDEIADALATTIQDLNEHWEVDQFYTVECKLTEQLRVERDKTVEIVQQLWFCLREGYTYNESQIHMRAFNEGKTTVKKLVVEDNNA